MNKLKGLFNLELKKNNSNTNHYVLFNTSPTIFYLYSIFFK